MRIAALRFLSFVFVLGSWELAGRWPVSAAFPPFSETMSAMVEMALDRSLFVALGVTLIPLSIGVAISGVIGIGAGIATGLSRRAEFMGIPLFIVLQAAPLSALIPILVLVYGAGLTSKVITVCILAMPVIVLNSFKAIRHTSASLSEMGRAFLGSRAQVVRLIILPAASPVIFAGLRLGLAAGFIGAVLAELLISPTGIGDLISYNQAIADYPKMFAAIVAVIILSVTMIAALEWVEIKFFRPESQGS